MASQSLIQRLGGICCALAALSAGPSLLAQSSSSADYAAQASSGFTLPADLQYRTQYQNQYPSGGGYHQYKAGDNSFSHIAAYGGVGFSVPVGTTPTAIDNLLGPPNNAGGDGNTLTANPDNNNINSTGYNFLVGGGYNFTRHIGAMIEYRFEHLGINGTVLNALEQNSQVQAAAPNGVNGNSHVWSLTLDPVYNFKSKGHWGGYVTGGGGFFRDLTTFNTPILSYCETFYGIVECEQNALLDHYSSNQGGFDLGGGATWKPNPDQHGSIFVDVRYEWIDTPGDATQTIPVTFGFRF